MVHEMQLVGRGGFCPMSTPIVFDVFGKRIQSVRTAEGWELFEVGNRGKLRRFGGTIVPPKLSEEQLIAFLDDLFHQYATLSHPRVRRVG